MSYLEYSNLQHIASLLFVFHSALKDWFFIIFQEANVDIDDVEEELDPIDHLEVIKSNLYLISIL